MSALSFAQRAVGAARQGRDMDDIGRAPRDEDDRAFGGLPWSVRQRLDFIEFRLFWDGRVNRSDLRDRFKISTPQATTDFARYAELAPGNIRYDSVERTYVPTESFQLHFYRLSPERLLLQYQALVENLIKKVDTFIGFKPELGIVPSLNRNVNAGCLKRILNAIEAKNALEIRYQSLSSPEPAMRWITPYALAYDGFRWHARAWCAHRQAFRDFVLARILDIGESRPARVDPTYDTEWNTEFTLRIAPHPKLPPSHRAAIALDYGMQDGVVEFKTTIYLAWYLTRRLLLDLDTDDLPPERLQLQLLNRNELITAQEEARGRAAAHAAIAEQG